MIKLPNYKKAFDYENDFYLSCESSRIAKIIAQYNLFEKTIHIEGDIVECGIFKGSSFLRFAMYRKIHNVENKKLVGFDSFDNFPETTSLIYSNLAKTNIDNIKFRCEDISMPYQYLDDNGNEFTHIYCLLRLSLAWRFTTWSFGCLSSIL